MAIILVNNADQTLEDFKDAVERALERCGEECEGNASDLCPIGKTGRLSGNINHVVEGNKMAFGTDVEYAIYVECGTGIYAESGGRQTPWVYKDDEGNWHRTSGQRPQPFIKPALADNEDLMYDIIRDELEG